MRKKQLALLAVILLVTILGACAAGLYLLLPEPRPNPPADSVMEKTFKQREASFVELVNMSHADNKVVRIAPEFTHLANDVSWPRPDSELGFTKDRWNEYRRLFAELGIKDGLTLHTETGSVSFFVYSWGLVTGGVTKGYVYSTVEPKPLSPSLDKIPNALANEGMVYKKIKDNWYLFLEDD